MSAEDIGLETQEALTELIAAVAKMVGEPISSVHICTSFEGSPEWLRLMEAEGEDGNEELEVVGGYPEMESISMDDKPDMLWSPLTITRSETDWMAYREWERQQMLNAFKVPPAMLNLDIQAQLREHREHNKRLQKWLHRVCPALERKEQKRLRRHWKALDETANMCNEIGMYD